MMSRTNMTSTSGVVLMSDMGRSSSPSPEPTLMAMVSGSYSILFAGVSGIHMSGYQDAATSLAPASIPTIRRAATQLPSRPASWVLPLRACRRAPDESSEEHTSELQSLMRISDAVFGL